ncbi:MAG: GntR family transcriptional regulator [Burkholderiales bacterium]|nr:GntR family transcriptional regulator [Burkholderiales bacterium]
MSKPAVKERSARGSASAVSARGRTVLDPGVAPRRRGAAAKPVLNVEAYEQLKHAIITLRFKPGEYLNAARVSELLGIGHTPVQQAINRLKLEGLVDILPRKGVIVKPVTLDEILNIIDVRLVNETYCARLAAARADEADIADLESILRDAQAAAARGDTDLQMVLDREFHGVLARASKNSVLGELMRGLHDRSLRFWFISLRSPEHHLLVHDEHAAILQAIKARDPEAAGEAVRRHIESFRHNIGRQM